MVGATLRNAQSLLLFASLYTGSLLEVLWGQYRMQRLKHNMQSHARQVPSPMYYHSSRSDSCLVKNETYGGGVGEVFQTHTYMLGDADPKLP